jgi:uncharacterized membrane protein
MRKSEIIILAIILLSFIIGIAVYPYVPAKLASHWNSQGLVDGYMPRSWAIFIMPILSIVIFLLFVLIPKIDPLKANIEKFRKYYDIFIVMIALFLLYIYLLTIFWNLGIRFDMIRLMMPALGLLFFYAGVLISNSKRNWSIGIRTPWTLSSEKVWTKTHQVGGKLFKIAGLITFLGVIFPQHAIWLVLLPIILAASYSVIYSYNEYKKEMKGKNKRK